MLNSHPAGMPSCHVRSVVPCPYPPLQSATATLAHPPRPCHSLFYPPLYHRAFPYPRRERRRSHYLDEVRSGAHLAPPQHAVSATPSPRPPPSPPMPSPRRSPPLSPGAAHPQHECRRLCVPGRFRIGECGWACQDVGDRRVLIETLTLPVLFLLRLLRLR